MISRDKVTIVKLNVVDNYILFWSETNLTSFRWNKIFEETRVREEEIKQNQTPYETHDESNFESHAPHLVSQMN